MKKYPLIGGSIVAVVLLVLSSSVSSLETTSQNYNEITNQHSCHMILSGKKIWKVIKFNFSQETILNRHISCRCSMNDSTISFIAELFDGGGSFYSWNIWAATIANPDHYLQYKFGRFYGFHSHNKNVQGWANGAFLDFGFGVLNSTSTYYTFISYMNNSYYDIWLNWTGNATISETAGTDVFAYDRHDFTGNLNIGRKRGTYIINGAKEISIENKLVAWYLVPNYSTGHEILKFNTPTGKEEWASYKDKKGEHVSVNVSSFHFYDDLLWGPSGTWQFSINMFNRGLQKKTPNVCLIGADIRRPD